jgi:hypothetical protein
MPEDRLIDRLPGILKRLLRFWVQVVAVVLLVSLVFGPFAPLVVAAVLLTLYLPVLALTLWGRALDEQMGAGRRDDGPW